MSDIAKLHTPSWLVGHQSAGPAAIVLTSLASRAATVPLVSTLGGQGQTIATARHRRNDLLTARAGDVRNPHGYHLLLSGTRALIGEHHIYYPSLNALFDSLAVWLAMLVYREVTPVPSTWRDVGLLMALNPMPLCHSYGIPPCALQFCFVR